MFARRFRFVLIVFLVANTVDAQDGKPPSLKNPGFEDGEIGKVPPEWFFPPICKEAGYSLTLSDQKPFAGKRCALLMREKGDAGEAFGNLIQSVDAKPFRGKRIRFKAAVRTEVAGENNQAMLWLRVDRAKEQMGFFDNMADRPIKSKEWKHYEIVGDIADDAEDIVLGMLLLGNGKAFLDDVSLEVVDKATAKVTGESQRAKPAPGLAEVAMAHDLINPNKTKDVTLLYPLPLAYRDQVPLTFHLTVEPPEAAKSIEISNGAGENRVLKLSLTNLEKHERVHIAYHGLVLVAPTPFDDVPKSVPFPKDWPAEVKPWLESTWSADHENQRVKKIAEEIRGGSDDVMVVISKAIERAQSIFAKTKGHVTNLTSVEALDKTGSCTSCANLVTALLRGAGVPARVLAGYPIWSGPLQTHYIVEAYVPGYGWYPIESTMCRAPWPNHQQIAVSIVPIENERQDKAGQRKFAAGAVPYMSLTECDDPKANLFSMGTLNAKQYCDHEARLMRAINSNGEEWKAAMLWAKPRWEAWTKSKPELKNGKLDFGPTTDTVKATTPKQLMDELK